MHILTIVYTKKNSSKHRIFAKFLEISTKRMPEKKGKQITNVSNKQAKIQTILENKNMQQI